MLLRILNELYHADKGVNRQRVALISHKVTDVYCCLLLLQILNELYHADKGFNRQRAVFLSPKPPGLDIQHLLATHSASAKLSYLQGSPFRMEVRVTCCTSSSLY